MGETITDSSPVIRTHRSFEARGIRRKTLSRNIELALRKSGIPLISTFGNIKKRMRPYSLRKYFKSNLTGRVPSEYSEAWLGHTRGMESTYNGVNDFDPTTLSNMRATYKEAIQYLIVETDEAHIMNRVNAEMQKRDQQIGELEAQLKEMSEKLENAIVYTSTHEVSKIVEKGYDQWLKDHPYMRGFFDLNPRAALDVQHWIAFERVIREERKKNPNLPHDQILKIAEKRAAEIMVRKKSKKKVKGA